MTGPRVPGGNPADPFPIVNSALDVFAHQEVYAPDPTEPSLLTFAYLGGRWGGFAISNGSVALTNNAENYIVVNRSTGVLSVSTTTTNWNDSAYARVMHITTLAGARQTVRDYRAGPGGVHGAASGFIQSIVAGDGVTVDNTDPQNPVVSADGGGGGGGITLGTAQATTSGTSKSFAIPAGVNRVTLSLVGVSTNGTSLPQVQLSAGGTYVTSGYAGVASRMVNSASPDVGSVSSGFPVNVGNASSSLRGTFVLNRVDGNTWNCVGSLASTAGTVCTLLTVGSITLGGALDGVRLTTLNGTDAFDAGTVNVSWE